MNYAAGEVVLSFQYGIFIPWSTRRINNSGSSTTGMNADYTAQVSVHGVHLCSMKASTFGCAGQVLIG